MFTREELQGLDRHYFSVVVAEEKGVTLISKCTRHVWYIQSVDVMNRRYCLVYHKHNISDPYHNHSKCGTLAKAVKDIKKHDKYQLYYRKNA